MGKHFLFCILNSFNFYISFKGFLFQILAMINISFDRESISSVVLLNLVCTFSREDESPLRFQRKCAYYVSAYSGSSGVGWKNYVSAFLSVCRNVHAALGKMQLGNFTIQRQYSARFLSNFFIDD